MWTKILAVLMLVFVAANSQAAETLTGDQLQQAIATVLVLDQDVDRTRLGAKTIGQLYVDHTELMDCVAEMLHRSIGRSQRGESVDVVAVYAAVLGKSKNPRYRNVLLAARRGKNEDKVNREIDAALALLGQSSADPYQPGSIDVVAKMAELRAAFEHNRKSSRDGLMRTVLGSNLRDVLTALGAPDEVSAITQVGSIGKRAMIVTHYYGMGLIAFRLERDADTQWSVYEIANEKTPVTHYHGTQKWFAQAIASMRGIQYRNLIRFYSQQIQTDPGIIDVLTQRLIVMDDLDDYETDATKYIPEVLKRTSVANETPMWKEVELRARTRVVRKVAAVRIKQLRKMKVRA